MNMCKRFYLLLCSLLLCCVGFLSVSSRAYAYTAEDGFYPLDFNMLHFNFFNIDGNKISGSAIQISSDYKYNLGNSLINDIYTLNIFADSISDNFVFPYNPTIYDYYFLGSSTAPSRSNDESTWKPTYIYVAGYDPNTGNYIHYPSDDMNVYNIDSDINKGFGFSFKIGFDEVDNIGINNIYMSNDKDGTGSKPANLTFQFGVLAVEKGQSETAVLSQILNQLQEMENSITDSIGSAADQVTDAIENQYGMASGEDFGVQDLTSQVEEKLGVLSFGADTLNNFLGLFQASNAGSTVLTFPGFSIDVQGESYQVWNDMQFDLAFLEENFGILITAVRTVTVLCVWLAVLGYLVKAYEHLVNNKG